LGMTRFARRPRLNVESSSLARHKPSPPRFDGDVEAGNELDGYLRVFEASHPGARATRDC
jgi:hypothetical protein